MQLASNKLIKLKGVQSQYSELEIEYLLSLPKTQLNPAEYLFIFKYEQRNQGYEEGGRRRLNEDDDLREIYDAMDEAHKKSSNRFVKACRAANLKCSNQRAKNLVALWSEGEGEE